MIIQVLLERFKGVASVLELKDYINIVVTIIGIIITGIFSWLLYKMDKKNSELSKKLANLELKSKKGYFLPKTQLNKSSVLVDFQHNLNKYVSFYYVGEDIACVKSVNIKINGNKKKTKEVKDLCFLSQEKFNSFLIELNLTEEELKQRQIDAIIEITMKNSKDYTYMQTLYLGFKNDSGTGTLNKFNMKLDEV